MIYNTNGPLNPILHKQIIVERDELTRSLAFIKNSDSYLAVSGPRQFGKTTLLYQIQQSLSSNRYGVTYIDFENMGDYDKRKFYSVVSENFWCSLRPTLENIQSEYPIEKVIDQDSFVRFLIYVSEHTPRFRKLIFLIDEVGGMPHELAWTSFLPSLRSIFNIGRSSSKDRDACSRLRFIFAGSTDLLKYVRHNSPIYNVCERVDVNEFTSDQVFQLTKKLIPYDEIQKKEIAQIVFGWTGGHPYLTQKTLSIIDENKTPANKDNLCREINQLIESKILRGQDKNISHIIKILRSNPEYKTIIYPIYKNQEKKMDVNYKDELLTEGLLKIDAETNFLKPRNKIYFQAINSFANIDLDSHDLKSGETSKFTRAFKDIFSLPRYIGSFILDTFGRHDSTTSTQIIWGYIIISITILITFRIVDINAIITIFVSIYRFFFPVK